MTRFNSFSLSKVYYTCALLIILGIQTSCSKKINTLALHTSAEVDSIAMRTSDNREQCDCLIAENYIPDGSFPVLEDIKTIRLNFHFPNAHNKKYNYVGEQAVQFAERMIQSANGKIERNKKMNLPEGNNTPQLDTRYRYELMKDPSTPSGLAVYEDLDDDLWYYIKKGKNKNNYNRDIIKKFARNDKEVLNVFAMAYPPDSIDQPGFKSGRGGIALGTSIKLAGIRKKGMDATWKLAGLFNHEIGHVFGLRHSWYTHDGCEDTPPNPNCWNSKKSGPCSGVTSNNMMDYNTQQIAVTPCQIGTVHKNIHRQGNKARGLVVADWCDYDYDKSLIIDETLALDRHLDLKGDIEILENAELRLSCRTHLPKGAKIIVHPGAKLILNGARLHNDCGEEWDGIEILSDGKKSGVIEYLGKVKIENLSGS